MADRSGNNKKKVNQGATLKKVFERLGKYRIFLIFSILLATVSVALTLYIPKLTGHAVDFIVSRGNVDFPGVLRVMVQIGICTLVTALAQWLMNVCNNKMTYQIVRDIRNEAFHKIEILPLKYIDGHAFRNTHRISIYHHNSIYSIKCKYLYNQFLTASTHAQLLSWHFRN